MAAPALALLLIATLIGSVGAAPSLAQDESPASGHAQVIAQGVAPMPQVPVAWRAIAADARPPAEAPVAERSLGFVVADVAPVVVTEEGTGDQVRLAPGEALFVPQGARQQRAGLPDTPVGYFGLELVVAPDVAAGYSLGSAALLFAGDPFAAPPGRRDLDLVRDTLAPGETARLPASAAPALLLVTDGAVRVQPVGGQPRTLRTYDAASLTGTLNVTAIGDAGATFVAAVIGPAVDPPGAAAAALPSPPEVAAPPATGTISVAPYACPDGMRPETFDPLACEPAPDVMALQTFVLGSGETLRTIADATYQDGAYLWSDLPFAEYLVQATDLAPGYDRYLIPGLDGINSPPETGYTTGPNEGYLVPLDAATPNYGLAVYAFRAAGPATAAPATLGIFVWRCAPGVVAMPDMTGADCVRVDPLASGFDVAISGGLAAPLTLADTAPADAAGRLWENVPLGNYTITATLPGGVDGYALRSYRADFPIRLLPDGTGYAFTLTDALFDPASDLRRVNIEAYLLVD